jgi:hypothetical protein
MVSPSTVPSVCRVGVRLEAAWKLSVRKPLLRANAVEFSPSSVSAFRLVTLVSLETASGGVPLRLASFSAGPAPGVGQ